MHTDKLDAQARAASISFEDLTSLALKAAIQLEELIRGQTKERDTVSEFVETLESMTDFDGRHASISFLEDPRTIGIYNRAVATVSESHLETIEDLRQRVLGYAQSYWSASANEVDLENLKIFCLALHQVLLDESYTGDHESASWESQMDDAASLY